MSWWLVTSGCMVMIETVVVVVVVVVVELVLVVVAGLCVLVKVGKVGDDG